MLRLPNGMIAVLDAFQRSVKFFRPDGSFAGSTGRSGSGPGEFLGPNWMGLCRGDSIVVSDYQNTRVSVIGPDLRVDRAFRYPGAVPDHIACLADGDFVFTYPDISAEAAAAPGPHRVSADVVLADARGRQIEKIGTFPGPDRYRFSHSDGPRDLGRNLVVGAESDRFFVGWADDYDVREFSEAGQPVREIRWSARSLKMSHAAWQAYVEQRIAAVPSGDVRQRGITARFLRSEPKPDRFPAYGRFLVDPDGRLWVEDYPRPTDSHRRWFVFGVTGHWLGTVAMPTALHVYQIGRTSVIGRWTDSSGVAYVVVYRLLRK